MIKSATLNDAFVPNRRMHLDRWAEGIDASGAFTSNIDEHVVSDIMALNGVENTSVKWNFHKYLVNGNGKFLDYFYSITKPLSSKITRQLK